jgi:eukaryotic-like serine/threonine-protein kinase
MTNAKPPRRGVPQPLVGGPQRFGPYLLHARLAAGATTEVYLSELADRVANAELPEAAVPRLVIKRLQPHLVRDAEGRAAFEREAALHGAVSHPNIVTLYGSGETDLGEPYLAIEYVDGCDVFRVLRRTTQARLGLPATVVTHIGRKVLAALGAIHLAKNAAGQPIHIVHRDVTPSNIYLSRSGDVKLGDFGIARARGPHGERDPGEARPRDGSLMGKFAYLAPEQVAGEAADHRSDLFSLVTLLAELAIGRPLFVGTSQLQVLLAIRDCQLTALDEAESRLPPAFFAVLKRGLARDPAARFSDAFALADALAPFEGVPERTAQELAARVTAVQTTTSEAYLAAVRESGVKTEKSAPRLDSSPTAVASVPPSRPALELDLDEEPGVAPTREEIEEETFDDLPEEDTGLYPALESFVQHANGERDGPWRFAQLVEGVAAGTLRHGDQVDYIGMGLRPIEDIPDLARLLPVVPAAAPSQETVPAAYAYDIAETSLLEVLAHVLVKQETGRLLLSRPVPDGGGVQEREVYFLKGRLHHVTSGKASELLGESLVRRGKLTRGELDMALAVLPRFGGRMTDTLIALGLVDGLEIFRAIREQGRDRLLDLFMWKEGSVSLFPSEEVGAVEFPLDLDLATLLLEGLEANMPGDAPMQQIEPRLGHVIVPHPRPERESFEWPELVTSVLLALKGPMQLRDLLAAVTRTASATAPEVVRALELLLAADFVRWK